MVSTVEQVFIACERARKDGDHIWRVSESDKEFHFQNWVEERLVECGLTYELPGRNTYPDFRLAHHPEGYEVKGLAHPGRWADYDSNSQVPAGTHNGRTVFYIFGRYPKANGDVTYPVIDLVICHGSFLSTNDTYVHSNKSFLGFGSYGDIRVRDRKMYVVPTPFALVEGTIGLGTLILPARHRVSSPELVAVGGLTRAEVDNVVISYEFNLITNKLVKKYGPNPTAGIRHEFVAYRVRGREKDTGVRMSTEDLDYAEEARSRL
ncbi:hypothetical protein [Nocardia arizonensis]|uniref:hypothetical protein n=1 Tax=Nocardia arizonensis TaxID=1141647 RepID=UPI0006D1961C|nr:hypothetical protein [Nocardia arizonensis]